MVWLTLYAERQRCWECSKVLNLFIVFVLHEEFFYLKDVVVEVDALDIKVHNNSMYNSLHRRPSAGQCTITYSETVLLVFWLLWCWAGFYSCRIFWALFAFALFYLHINRSFFMIIWHCRSQLKNVESSGIWTRIFRDTGPPLYLLSYRAHRDWRRVLIQLKYTTYSHGWVLSCCENISCAQVE